MLTLATSPSIHSLLAVGTKIVRTIQSQGIITEKIFHLNSALSGLGPNVFYVAFHFHAIPEHPVVGAITEKGDFVGLGIPTP